MECQKQGKPLQNDKPREIGISGQFGRFKKTVERHDDAIAETCHLLSIMYFREGDSGRALEKARKALEIEPDNPEYNRHMGDILLQAGKIEETGFYWERALRLDPQNPELHCCLGSHKLGRAGLEEKEAGMRHLKKALELRPGYCFAHYIIGLGKINMHGDYRGAIAEFGKALSISPNVSQYLFERARAKVLDGDAGGALSDLELLEKNRPGFPGALQLRGKAKVMLGYYVSEEGSC